ncbi:sigma-54 specific transcriptional regulator [Modicisalibacter ilicicola DSM 19980]|uniref:Sigma-54 specific transcriptional regulator n=1 Tax=Modicisalibacter ilicicola DSM 19980 TaxID=1121942 RepID=A0A1M5B3H0_9GAMM|nr:sigma 54-interacting transcriptional regulator [Halomonas ilicicola]SHF36970.1 sigma-54 specific transcriptional regulator [Halomonas ilicicola DSM 19980]
MSLDRMTIALDMLACPNTASLRERGRAALCETHDLVWSHCLALDASGRWLVQDDSEIRLACDDFRHPYAHAIRRGTPLTLKLGEARSRLDHPDFQAQVARLSSDLLLEIRPLRALDGAREWLGVLAFAASTVALDALLDDPGFSVFERLLCQLWARHHRQLDEHRQRSQLRDSLTKLNAGARRQALSRRLAETILGETPAIQTLREQIVRAAETSLAVLIQGETGSGKDLVARALHRLSARANGPFVALNCAAIPETLLESELFGHAKGAFSGADQARNGLLGETDGGTLFLDEIGDMPQSLQAKLLRVLESGRYRPLGESEERRADLRLVAATHQPLREHIRDGRFRADLFYRLSQFPLVLPPLRERRDDIALLAKTFIDEFCRRERRAELGITPAALRLLRERDYPGNIRELKNLIDYACAMTPAGEDVGPRSLLIVAEERAAPAQDIAPPGTTDNAISDLRQALRDYEARLIRERLDRFDGNRTLAAQSLGVPKRTLAHKCQLLELDP